MFFVSILFKIAELGVSFAFMWQAKAEARGTKFCYNRQANNIPEHYVLNAAK